MGMKTRGISKPPGLEPQTSLKTSFLREKEERSRQRKMQKQRQGELMLGVDNSKLMNPNKRRMAKQGLTVKIMPILTDVEMPD